MSESLCILILEDNSADAELIQFELQEAGLIFTAKVVMTEKDYVRELQEFCPDLILSDYDLPAYNGALALAESNRRCPDIPFILVTGAVSEERAIEILTQGAKDYVLKSRLAQRLAPAVRRALAEADEHRARKQAEEDLRKAHRDLEAMVRARTAALEAEIEKRRKIEESLRESERRERERALELETLLEAIPTPVFLAHDPGCIHLTGNRAAYDLLGIPHGSELSLSAPIEVRPRHFRAVKDGQELRNEELPAQRAARGIPVRDFEFSLVFEDGTDRHVLGYGTPLHDDKGRPRGSVHVLVDITERKKAETAAWVATQNLQSLLVNAKGFFIYQAVPDDSNPYGARVVLVSPSITDVSGITDAYNFGAWFENIDPDDMPKIIEANRRSLEAREPYDEVTRWYHRLRNEWIWLRTISNPVYDQEGRLVHFNGLCLDITERKRAEEALRENEERYRFLWEKMLQGVVHQDAEGEIISMNPAAERILGKSPGEFLGQTSVSVEHHTLHEDGSLFPGLEHPAMVALRTGQPVKSVVMGVFNPRENVYRWISIDAVPLFRTGEDRPFQVYTVFEDISEKRRIEEELRKSEGLYRAIGESIDYGIWVSDSEGRNLYASKSLLDLVGLTQEQCSNFGWLKVLHPDDTRPTITAWRECVRTGGNWNIEHRFRGADGQWYTVLARGVPVRNETGEIMFWAGINLDISSLKNAEMSLRERTEQLEELNKELESFSYSISHDLRAPLRAIDGFARKLEREYRGKGDENFTKAISVIRNNASIMGNLIEDLLSFSKVQKTGMNIAFIDMLELVNDVWNDIADTHKKRALKFQIMTILPGYGDRVLVRQVLFNLLSNAVKFTKDRKPGIIEVNSSAEQDRIVYTVKDNGAGFDMEYYDRLFGVFQRLHSHDEYDGTGIGLAIVQRIIKRHGGDVWAEGEVDKGATFHFSLPSALQR